MINANDMILAKNHYYDMDTRKTRLNNNVLVVGTSGAGKTRGIVTPNILQAVGSYVITDPKGNLYDKYANYLWEKGYVVKKVNFVDPLDSVKYNFFHYIHSSQDILKISDMIVKADHIGTAGRHIDPFWDEASCLLYQALIGYLYFHRPKRDWSLSSIMKLIAACWVDEYGDIDKSATDLIFDELREKDPHLFSVRQYDKFRIAASKTLRSILISSNAKLGMFDTEELQKMMSSDEINIPEIGQRKTAIFVVVSDTDRSMDMLVNIFFTQVINELCMYADTECADQCLPVPVRFIMDDFATNCCIRNFPRMIASIRSRGISTMLMVQAESQLTECYGNDGRTIIGNCDTYVYLGGNDIETARNISDRCGKCLQDVLYMPVGKEWIFRRGCKPMMADNFIPEDYEKECRKTDTPVQRDIAYHPHKDIRITGFGPSPNVPGH